MNNQIELIKTLTKEDYEGGRVNLHIHSTYSDGKAEFRQIVKMAKEKGIKAFAITDHNTVQGHIENPRTEVIIGAEFDVWYKYIFLHLLAYGFDTNNAGMQKFYAKDKKGTVADIVRIFAKRNLKELIDSIHQAGGIAVLAHPACCWALSLDTFVKELTDMGLDGIEVYYPYPRWRKYIKFSNPEQIEEIADKYKLIKTGGTDCHNLQLD
ncbi:MAG: PHP domain-containing protein [Muribaculaceae bacterium]|nr:PHP domain-containing protein [Muribaculaceae bacterium]